MSQVIKFPPRMDDIPGQLRDMADRLDDDKPLCLIALVETEDRFEPVLIGGDMVRQLGLVEILRQIMCNIALDDE